MLNSENQVLILSEKLSHANVTLVLYIKILHESVKFYIIFLNLFYIFRADRNTKTVHLYIIWLVYTVQYCEHICTVRVQCTSDSNSIVYDNSWSVVSAALHISPYFDSCAR